MNLRRQTVMFTGAFRRKTSRGFTLVSAIFLLVALAGLGVAMVNFSTVQHTSSALDIEGARAYQAARAGVEWGLFQQLRRNSCNPVPTSFALPAGSALSTFTVTVTCTVTPGPGGVAALHRWRIVATACNRPGGGEPRCPNPDNSSSYVERVVQVDF